MEQNTLQDLINIVKGSSNVDNFIELLERFNEFNADTRNRLNIENDSLEIRKGVVRLVESGLIVPLTQQKPQRKTDDSDIYR
jgi:hypothetical protein